MSDMPVIDPDAPKASLPVCEECGAALERVRRTTFMQLRVYPLFDRFPWQCVTCRNLTYRTARHRRELRRQYGVSKDSF
jgi:uncharacterized protein with PIN domain